MKDINVLTKIIESYTNKKVVLKEEKRKMLVESSSLTPIKIYSTEGNLLYLLKGNGKYFFKTLKTPMYQLPSKIRKDEQAIEFVDKYAKQAGWIEDEEEVLSEEEQKSVNMTTDELLNNEDKVDKIASKGYDINLTDLKENDNQFQGSFVRADKVVDSELPKGTTTQERLDAINPLGDSDYTPENPEQNNKYFQSLIKKLGEKNNNNWKEIKSNIENAWSELKNKGVIKK